MERVISESSTIRDLVARGYHPNYAVKIYQRFVYDYKNKHVGQLDVTNHQEWYARRAAVFDRFVRLYHRGGE